MPKRASTEDTIDPVRSRLAAAASAPVSVAARPAVKEPAATAPQAAAERPGEAVGGEEGDRPQGRVRPNTEPSRAVRGLAFTIHRKIMVTPEEAERIEQATDLISSAFGSKVTYSQVSRAMWSVLGGAEDAIKAGARRAPRGLSVPSKGDHVGMAEYEEAIADFLLTALKRS